MNREPAVAGRFYPARSQELAVEVDSFLGTVQAEPAIGVMVPHAGYPFSGVIAGATFSRVVIPQTVILLGPNHHGYGAPAALWSAGRWKTPLGEIAIDTEVAHELLAASPLLQSDIAAHRYEHSLEVQVPFLQRLNPLTRIVPLSIGRVTFDDLLEIGRALAQVAARQEERPLLVASSDMTHYESAETARRKDHQALARICALDPQGLYQTVRDEKISMCGVLPTVIMLSAARELGALAAEVVRYGHSGEVTGEGSEVVGYAGVVVR